MAEPVEKRFDLVIFDCDGVLVDSEPLVNRAYVEMLREAGFSLSESDYLRELAGAAMSTRLGVFSSRLGWVAPPGFEQDFARRLERLIGAELQPVDGVRALLSSLKVPICVASNGGHHEIRTRLEVAALRAYFAGNIFSAEDVPRVKPAPDVFLHAAAQTAVAPERCVVVEDSVPGVLAAVAAGMQVYGYARLVDAGALRDAGATTFTAMTDLASLLA